MRSPLSRRVSRVLTVAALTLSAALATATVASAAAYPDDSRASFVSGNVTTCAQIGLPNDTSDLHGITYTVDATNTYVTIDSVAGGVTLDAVVVKGGDGYNRYPAAVFNTLPTKPPLESPLPSTKAPGPATISHWFVCAKVTGSQGGGTTTTTTTKPTTTTSAPATTTSPGSGSTGSTGTSAPAGAAATTTTGAAPGTTPLANTGFANGWLVPFGAALLLAGVVVLLVTRTRAVRRR